MKYLQIRQRLSKAGVTCFTPLEFQRLMSFSKVATQKILERYTQKGIFTRIKKGLYLFTDGPYSLWGLANKIYQPSYISMETALSYYGIIPESVYAITSATSKITRTFKNNSGSFSYRKIKRKAFTGYQPIKISDETVLVAESAKALADYLYFVFQKKIVINERLRWHFVKKTQLKNYIKKFENKNFERWASNVIGKHYT